MYHCFVLLLLFTITCSSAFVLNAQSTLGVPRCCRTSIHKFTPLHMFTGIVEEMGKVVSLEERDDMILWDGSKGKGTEIVVEANVVMGGAYLG
jgi:hypothetical protein